ncbi:hypothetical protein GB2207_03424 [marine gamma proteobacterium HTCC2207]|uniref:Lipoprotein n=1 Tax=gamma proteobacterium HTCC2207 TaxID=314287 RepID=Q1YRF3_9GAMM|nr:hypothetical protein GB2207_03424 [marine gamma proteobacterium HTCC2207] [gamma proteobacterium HTCC2207]
MRQTNHFGAILALSLSLILTACGGGGSTVTDNPAADPGPDGIAPTLLNVSIKQSKTRNGSADGTAKLGDSITVTFEASEGLMRPEVTIGGFAADVNGKIGDWTAVREMTELDMDGVVDFTITYTDISGVEGVAGTATTDESAVEYCAEGCVEPEPISLTGTWRLDAAGVGPAAGSREWFALNRSNADDVAARPCLFDDAFVLGADGSFANQMGDTTWVEGWQDTEAGEGACLTPVAPHDGSIAASYVYDEAAATLTLNGQGAHLGLAKVVNGSELASPSEAPESVTYTVLTFDGDFLSVVVVAGDGVYWSYDLVKDQPSALAGTWRLGAAGVGPSSGSREWFALNRSSADDVAARPCLFDDAFVIGADGSFANQMGDTTWVEGWQNADAGEGACLTPVAPHDGSIAASSVYDEAAGTLTLNGKGAHLGLAKVVNGSELASPSDAPESVTYTVLTFDGDFLSVEVVAGDGVYWSYDLVKDQPSALAGTWRLDAAGVGPSSGSREWFALNRSSADDVAARPCLFDDAFVIGADGSFANQMGDATWVEAWQGAAADGCATPVAPHDGSIAASSVYDEAAGTLTLNGKGAHLGLAKVVNGSELASPSDAPESVTYTVLTFDGDFLSVEVVAGDGVYWSYDLVKDADTTDTPDASSSVLEGKWVLDAAGVGPSSGSREWFALNRSTDADVAARPCLFDDAFVIGADGSFANQMGDATWVEAWQGAAADGCATPVAPHDGSIAASSVYDEAAGTLTLNGKGAHLGLAKVVNGSELASPSDAPESVTYTVLIIESDFLSVEVVAGDGVYWSYDFVKQ